MSRLLSHLIFLGAASCLGMTAASADQLYKWVDAQGHVHYSQTPPPGATKAKPVEIHVTPADPAVVQQQQAEKEQAEKDAAMTPEEREAARQLRCKPLRAQLSAYTHSDAAPSADRQKAIDDLKAQMTKEGCD